MFGRKPPAEIQAAAILKISAETQRIAAVVDGVLRRELRLSAKLTDQYGRVVNKKVPAACVYPWNEQLRRPDIAATETPFGYRIPIARIPVGQSLISHQQVQAIAQALSLQLGVTCTFEPTPGGGPLQCWVPKTEPVPTFWFNMINAMDSGMPPMHAALGLDRMATPVVMDWANGPDKHVAVLGTTTSGKSRLADMMLLSLALHTTPAMVRFVIFDCKDQSHASWTDMPHTMLYAGGGEHNKDEILHGISRLYAVLTDRHARGLTEGAGRVGVDVPYIVVLIDDAREPEAWSKDYREIVGSLLRLGASAGLRVLLTAHEMREDWFGDASRTNLSTRIVAGSDIYKSAGQVGSGQSGAHQVDRSQREFILRQNNTTRTIFAPHLCQEGRFLDLNKNGRDDVAETIGELRKRHGHRQPFPWPADAAEPFEPDAPSKIVTVLFQSNERQSNGVSLSDAIARIEASVAGWPADQEFRKADAAEAIWGKREYGGTSATKFLNDAYEAAIPAERAAAR